MEIIQLNEKQTRLLMDLLITTGHALLDTDLMTSLEIATVISKLMANEPVGKEDMELMNFSISYFEQYAIECPEDVTDEDGQEMLEATRDIRVMLDSLGIHKLILD